MLSHEIDMNIETKIKSDAVLNLNINDINIIANQSDHNYILNEDKIDKKKVEIYKFNKLPINFCFNSFFEREKVDGIYGERCLNKDCKLIHDINEVKNFWISWWYNMCSDYFSFGKCDCKNNNNMLHIKELTMGYIRENYIEGECLIFYIKNEIGKIKCKNKYCFNLYCLYAHTLDQRKYIDAFLCQKLCTSCYYSEKCLTVDKCTKEGALHPDFKDKVLIEKILGLFKKSICPNNYFARIKMKDLERQCIDNKIDYTKKMLTDYYENNKCDFKQCPFNHDSKSEKLHPHISNATKIMCSMIYEKLKEKYERNMKKKS